MADLKISQLPALAGSDLLAADQLAVADTSASETKRITVTDLVGNAVTLIADATIPGAKILFSAGGVAGTAIADGGVTTAKLAADSVTAAKLADESTVDLVTTLPAAGAFTGQIALDTDDSKIYVWNGSAWVSVKGAGSVNVVNGSTTGVVNITSTTSGDTCTIAATLDDTSAAAQFLGGPTGAGGTVGYRTIIGTDLPTPTTSAKGGVIVNGNGLAMSGDTLTIDNTVTAEASENHIVQYDANGLVTGGRVIAAADVPVATSSTVGVIKPGSGLGVDAAGQVSHNNSITAGTAAKVSFDTEGHITATEALAASDIPNLDASKVTTGTLPEARIGSDAVTAEKLADRSTATIAESTPTGGAFIGQCHLNSITGDYFLWDGNVWQPIGISVGEIVLAGTYNASTNKVATVTSEGTALSFVVGSALPAASSANKGYYVVVSTAGTGTSPAPTVALNPPDFLLSTGTSYTEIDVSSTVTAQQASNVAFTAAGNIGSTNVQAAIEELDTEKAPKANPTLTGTVALGEDAVLTFEGATDNAFETTLTVADPTADRTITLPNVTGTVLTTGDTGTVTSTMIVDGAIVNADINAAAEIAVSKLANGTARQLLQTDSLGSGVEFTSNVDVPGTLDVTGASTLDSTLAVTGATTVTGVINANGKVKFPAGTVTAPSFHFGTDTNTGLYHPAADKVAITTGGTQRVIVDSAGNVGIGTSSPNAASGDKALHIHSSLSSGTRGACLHLTTNSSGTGSSDGAEINLIDNDLKIFNKESGIIYFGTSNAERMRIDSSGRVGIGTSSPGANLEVTGPTGIATDGVPTLYLNRAPSVGSTSDIALQANAVIRSEDSIRNVVNDGGVFGWWIGGTDNKAGTAGATEVVRIASDGKVGIGDTNPSYPLCVYGDNISQVVSVESSKANARIKFTDVNSTNGAFVSGKGDALAFETAGNNERMRIDSSGKVGIGTTSPSAQLEVTSASSEVLLLLNGASAKNVYADIDADANRRGVIRFQSAGTSQWSVGRGDSDELAASSFHISRGSSGGNNAKFVIDSSGNVGIGTTSPGNKLHVVDSGATGIRSQSESAQATDTNKALQVSNGDTTDTFNVSYKGQGYFAGNVGIGTTSPGSYSSYASNLVVNEAGNAGISISSTDSSSNVSSIHFTGGTTRRHYIEATNGSNGNFVFQTGGTGPFRFLDSTSERMRIDGSGRVGIGTTSPSSKLHVNGTITDSIGPLRRLGQNIQSSNYTLVASDAGKQIRVGGGHTITIPDNVFSTGDMVTIVAHSSSDVSITQGSGVSLFNAADGSTGNKTLKARTMCSILVAEGGSSAKMYIAGGGIS